MFVFLLSCICICMWKLCKRKKTREGKANRLTCPVHQRGTVPHSPHVLFTSQNLTIVQPVNPFIAFPYLVNTEENTKYRHHQQRPICRLLLLCHKKVLPVNPLIAFPYLVKQIQNKIQNTDIIIPSPFHASLFRILITDTEFLNVLFKITQTLTLLPTNYPFPSVSWLALPFCIST